MVSNYSCIHRCRLICDSLSKMGSASFIFSSGGMMFGEIGLSSTMRHHEVQISYLEANSWPSIILVASIGGKMCHCYPCLSYFNSWLAVFLSPRHLVYHIAFQSSRTGFGQRRETSALSMSSNANELVSSAQRFLEINCNDHPAGYRVNSMLLACL